MNRRVRLVYASALLTALFAPLTSHAGNLECYEEKGTMNTMCIQPSAVRQNGDLRSSPIFMGGPKSVEPTSFTLVTNCAKGISTLQDRQGKNFGGAHNSDTPAIRALSSWLCAVSKPKKDPSLRQF